MKPYVKFCLIFLPVAFIATFAYHAIMSVVQAHSQDMPNGTSLVTEGLATWSTSIMVGCGLALLVALVSMRKWVPIITVLLYMFAQSSMAVPFAIIMSKKPEWGTAALGVGIMVSGLIMILLVHAMHFYNAKHTFRNCISALLTTIAVIAAITGALAGNIANEQLALPNLMEQEFTDMSQNIIGILAIAVIGPIAEEIVFRGAVCGSLLKKGVPTGLTILISAMLFGLIHFNPAQIPFAFVMGLVLGYIYCRTGSLVPTIITHILNNSISVFLMAKYGEEANDMTFADMLGSQTAAWVLMAVFALISIGLLYVLHTKAEPAKVLWDRTNPEEPEMPVTPPPIPQIPS